MLREVVDEEGARHSDALCSLAETLSLAPPTLESALKNGDFKVSQTETTRTRQRGASWIEELQRWTAVA